MHYVLSLDIHGGYEEENWNNFIKYCATSMQAVYQVSPADFVGN